MRSTRHFIFLILLLGLSPALRSARIDSLAISSPCSGQRHPALLIRPDSGQAQGTLILLHGYGGDYLSWSRIEPELSRIADSLGLAIVMPEGYNSWYLDHETIGQCMTTFIGSELIGFLRDSLNLAEDSAHTYIAGFSMGGQGALRVAARFPSHFSLLGCMSGSLDFNRSRLRNEILRFYGQGRTAYIDSASVMAMSEQLRPFHNAIFIDCGQQDYLIDVSEDFHRKLQAAGIGHTYIIRPGRHDEKFWKESLQYFLTFITLHTTTIEH
jgi:S-formylglutathione hydrolase FrmB